MKQQQWFTAGSYDLQTLKLLSSSQCLVWTPSSGVGLKPNQKAVAYSCRPMDGLQARMRRLGWMQRTQVRCRLGCHKNELKAPLFSYTSLAQNLDCHFSVVGKSGLGERGLTSPRGTLGSQWTLRKAGVVSPVVWLLQFVMPHHPSSK